MFDMEKYNSTPEIVLQKLDMFEKFCTGDHELSPQEFTTLNVELSASALMHIGRKKLVKKSGDKHFVWRGLDDREHDLGPADALNIIREAPGFHKIRSMSLGHNYVESNEIKNIEDKGKNVSVVKMKDGSIGIGPNYRIALRNASLRMHLKNKFNLTSKLTFWQRWHGNA